MAWADISQKAKIGIYVAITVFAVGLIFLLLWVFGYLDKSKKKSAPSKTPEGELEADEVPVLVTPNDKLIDEGSIIVVPQGKSTRTSVIFPEPHIEIPHVDTELTGTAKLFGNNLAHQVVSTGKTKFDIKVDFPDYPVPLPHNKTIEGACKIIAVSTCVNKVMVCSLEKDGKTLTLLESQDGFEGIKKWKSSLVTTSADEIRCADMYSRGLVDVISVVYKNKTVAIFTRTSERPWDRSDMETDEAFYNVHIYITKSGRTILLLRKHNGTSTLFTSDHWEIGMKVGKTWDNNIIDLGIMEMPNPQHIGYVITTAQGSVLFQSFPAYGLGKMNEVSLMEENGLMASMCLIKGKPAVLILKRTGENTSNLVFTRSNSASGNNKADWTQTTIMDNIKGNIIRIYLLYIYGVPVAFYSSRRGIYMLRANDENGSEKWREQITLPRVSNVEIQNSIILKCATGAAVITNNIYDFIPDRLTLEWMT